MGAEFELVEKIRGEIRMFDFKPLNEDQLREMKNRVEGAVNNNAIEDSIRTKEEVALDDMLIQERAPDQVRMYASRRYLEGRFHGGKSLKGKIFPECEN